MRIFRHFGLVASDAALGICATFFVCALFGVHITAPLMVLGIVFAYLPDLDWVLDAHFLKTGRVAAYASNPYDHREGLHKPILWWLVISGWGIAAPGVAPFIAFVAVTCHFLHDTVGTGWGMPWLWPLTKRRFKLFSTKQNEMTLTPFMVSWPHDELAEVITKYGRANWKEYYYGSWTPVSIGECSITLVGILMVIVWLV